MLKAWWLKLEPWSCWTSSSPGSSGLIFMCELVPIPSMYGIFTYIYRKHQPNVGKYTIHGYTWMVCLPSKNKTDLAKKYAGMHLWTSTSSRNDVSDIQCNLGLYNASRKTMMGKHHEFPSPLGCALGHIHRSDEFHAAGCCESLCPNLGNSWGFRRKDTGWSRAIIGENIGNPHAKAWPAAESNMVQRLMDPESENFRDAQIFRKNYVAVATEKGLEI